MKRTVTIKGLDTGIFRTEKWKLIFSVFYPHGSKEKISGLDFEIRATNFEKQATNFSPSENLFEKRPENADKKAAFAAEYLEERKICSVYESTKSAQCQNLWQIIRA